jgi:hypothetical protein
MQLVLGRLAATQSAKPLTLSLLVDQPFFTDLVVPENFGRPGSAAGAAALIYIYISSPYITIYRCDDSGYPLGLHRGAFLPRTWQSSSNAATPRIKRGTSHGDPLCAGRVIPASLGILDSDL